MANDLFNQLNGGNGGLDMGKLMSNLNQIKNQVSDPNKMIQQMLSSGRISQSQLNAAYQKAQQLMQMLPTGGRR